MAQDSDYRFFEQEKHAAAAWARDLVASGFVVLDTETTGLNRERDDEACQIAVVASDGTVLLDTLVKPSLPIEPGAARIHGITDEMVKDAPTFVEILPHLHEALDGRVVVIYNADFDAGIIGNMILSSSGAPERNYMDRHFSLQGLWCAMQQYARFYGEWNDYHESFRWQRLGSACAELGIHVVGPAHSALGDALRTLALIQKMAAFGDALWSESSGEQAI